jgi:hypothetical protein
MIKIERITADKPTLLRNDVRQPVTLGMTVTDAELATIEATDGAIVYSVDELEVKELVFHAKPAPVPPAAKPAKPTIVKPVSKAVKPSVEPASKVTQAP